MKNNNDSLDKKFLIEEDTTEHAIRKDFYGKSDFYRAKEQIIFQGYIKTEG